MKNLVIIGAGGHGKVVADCADLTGRWSGISYLDDRFPELAQVAGWPVTGPASDWVKHPPDTCDFLVAIGDNRTRLRFLIDLLDRGLQLPVLVHPRAAISTRAALGPGTVVFAQSVVNIGTYVGVGAILNTGCLVDHDCLVGDGVHISPGANLAGNVTVGPGSWIGIGASIRQGIVIGRDVTIGAGAAVVADIPDLLTVAGVPAKKLTG